MAYTVSASAKLGVSVLFDKIIRVDIDSTLGDVFSSVNVREDVEIASVKVGEEKGGPWADISATETIQCLKDMQWRCIKYFCAEKEAEEVVIDARPAVNAFEEIMSRNLGLPSKLIEHSKKHKLFNDIVTMLEERGLGFSRTIKETEGAYVCRTLRDPLWYITEHHSTLNTKAAHYAEMPRIPELFSRFEHYNDWRAKKKKKPDPLKSPLLKSFATDLFHLLSKPSIGGEKWREIRQAVETLANCLAGYSEYLNGQVCGVMKRQRLTHPPRQVATDATIRFLPKAAGDVAPQQRKLDEAMRAAGDEEYVVFDETIHMETPLLPPQMYYFRKNLQLSVDVDCMSYAPGGSYSTVMILKKVAKSDRSANEVASDTLHFYEAVKQQLPVFHTREMKRTWRKQYENLTKVTPQLMRSMYQTLTMDASTDQNPIMDARLKMALQGEPDIILDLRTVNSGRPGDTFSAFFEELGKEIEEVTAAEDRRHGAAHLSHWISIPDMIERVRAKLPSGTPVPTPALVRLQFMPRNNNSNTALTFTRRFEVQYKIQRRQLRASHPDTHYCMAIYKYMREMAIQLRECCVMLSMDDKSKVSYGEPGTAMSSGVRGKKTIAPTSSVLAAADHDQNSKGNITPSVILDIDIPEDSSNSFCQGKVTVILNDAIFQPSSPFRHSASIKKYVPLKPVLLLFTDGGPDHRLTYESVKMSLVALFRATNLDLLVAGRCAPGNSWINPVERIMSILNLGLQNVSLGREAVSEEAEKLLRKCSSMAQIRTAADKEDTEVDLREEWAESLKPMIDLLRERFERLKLKDEKVVTKDPVTTDAVEGLQSFITNIDAGVDFNKLQKKHLTSRKEYNSWVARHCRATHYTFQIRKCEDKACCQARQTDVPLHWLLDPVPDAGGEHFKSFQDLWGTDTTEEYRPSLNTFEGKADEEEQGCRTSLLTAQNAKRVVKCQECGKPRVIYSNCGKRLTPTDLLDVDSAAIEYDYTCGSPFLPKDHRLFKKVFVRHGIRCENLIETPYYTSAIGLPDTCVHCGQDGGTRPAELVERFKTVLPACQDCIDLGKKAITARPRPQRQGRQQ